MVQDENSFEGGPDRPGAKEELPPTRGVSKPPTYVRMSVWSSAMHRFPGVVLHAAVSIPM